MILAPDLNQQFSDCIFTVHKKSPTVAGGRFGPSTNFKKLN